MPDYRKISRASMKSIIDWFGCYDAVAETINSRWGGGASKGTVSKKASGALDWTIADVIALEDASGRFPVTRMMTRRLSEQDLGDDGCLLQDGSSIAKESGEALKALLDAQQSNSADDLAQAVCEINEAIEALKKARRRVKSRMNQQ